MNSSEIRTKKRLLGHIQYLFDHAVNSQIYCKMAGECVIHVGQLLRGQLQVRDSVSISVDVHREQISNAHTATHLLHSALHQVLGDNVRREGSTVDLETVRFDFACPRPLLQTELDRIESLFNTAICCNASVQTITMSLDEARSLDGLRAYFDNRYGDNVRVVEIAGSEIASRELGSGPHADTTCRLGIFKITSCTAASQFVRRINACIGKRAEKVVKEQKSILQSALDLIGDDCPQLEAQICRCKSQLRQKKKFDLQPRSVEDEFSKCDPGESRPKNKPGQQPVSKNSEGRGNSQPVVVHNSCSSSQSHEPSCAHSEDDMDGIIGLVAIASDRDESNSISNIVGSTSSNSKRSLNNSTAIADAIIHASLGSIAAAVAIWSDMPSWRIRPN